MRRRTCPPQGCDDSNCDGCFQDALDLEIYLSVMQRAADREQDYPPPLRKPTGDTE